MAWTAPPTVLSGQLMVAPFWNLAVRDNALALRSGSIAIAFQDAGQLIIATSSEQWTGLAGVEGQVAARAGGVWTTIALVDLLYPVGSIFRSTFAANPATLLGGGTWVAFGTGQTIVGVDAGQAEFTVVEATGGASTHTLTVAEMPLHTHAVADPLHAHETGTTPDNSGPDTARRMPRNYPGDDGNVTTSSAVTNITVANTGAGAAHNNRQPFISAYQWKRVA